jgi:DNA-directed RNA polymerase specialized sigma24 family protein
LGDEIKIAHNILRRRYSRASRLRAILETSVAEEVSQRHELSQTQSVRPSTRDARPELTPKQLGLAMEELTQDERDALQRTICEGKSYEHAALSLGVNVTTLKNWKHRGLSKLRRLAAAYQGADFVPLSELLDAA